MDKWNIIMKTAKELAQEYHKEGWSGDCNDFTQASSSISQELTNREMETLWEEFSDQELLTDGMIFTFTQQGRDKIITVKNCP
jgi:hypothetical protein